MALVRPYPATSEADWARGHDLLAARAAHAALRSCDLMEVPNPDLEQIARRLGLRVEFLSAESLSNHLTSLGRHIPPDRVRRYIGGFYAPRGVLADEPVVAILGRGQRFKRRFTLAHEIGHHLSNELENEACTPLGVVEPRFMTSGNQYMKWKHSKSERLASDIGRFLLMNPTTFPRDIRNKSLFDLADTYKVPSQVVLDHVLNLDICPMAVLTCNYNRETSKIYSAKRLSPKLSASASLRLVKVIAALAQEVPSFSKRLTQWARTRRLSTQTISVEGCNMGLAVYNSYKTGHLLMLAAEVSDLRLAGLLNPHGLFSPLVHRAY